MNKVSHVKPPIPQELLRPATPELEAADLAEVRAEVAAGKWVSAERVFAWLEQA